MEILWKLVLFFGMVVSNNGFEGMALDHGMDTKNYQLFSWQWHAYELTQDRLSNDRHGYVVVNNHGCEGMAMTEQYDSAFLLLSSPTK